ncbi:MAG TPA: hypothetical protein PKD90_13565 [Phnomibacter sp.]|nr:hypothetical protein [Phnomibacter sp.]
MKILASSNWRVSGIGVIAGLILAYTFVQSWLPRQSVILNGHHYAAITLYAIWYFVLIKRPFGSIVVMALFMLLASINLLWLWPANQSVQFCVGPLCTPYVQPTALGMLIVHLWLNFNHLVNAWLNYKEGTTKFGENNE